MIFSSRSRRSWRQGQSLTEFAIVFPVLLLVIGGIIQFGVIFWGQNTLNQLVRDTGRYAVTVPDCSTTSRDDILAKVDTVAAQTNFAGRITGRTVVLPTTTPPDPVSDTCPATSNANQVWLRITIQADVPIFFPFIPVSGSLSSTAVFRMEPVTAP